ncbi:hypothetical protein ACE1CB_11535 [Aerosakkonema sp. BLCC-F2]
MRVSLPRLRSILYCVTMSFAIFDEGYYLEKNPDVAAAVKAGTFQSGLQHFQLVGMQEGRTSVSPFWSEGGYYGSGFLPNNFDVLSKVMQGELPSALAHFIQTGEAEGRVISDAFYNERFYLERNRDVANAVAAEIFASGFSHFIQIGKNEGRQGSAFNEKAYLAFNPDVAAAVSSGVFSSALEHYTESGRSESRAAFLSGSKGNDYVSAFDTGNSTITGVAIDVITGSTPEIVPTSLGVGEVDTLIGSNSGISDRFILGVGRSASNPTPLKFYVGQGDADYALISHFDILGGDAIVPGLDLIQLAGKPEDYVIQTSNETFKTNIFAIVNGGNTPQLDLIAVVDSPTLAVRSVDSTTETFTLSAQPQFS